MHPRIRVPPALLALVVASSTAVVVATACTDDEPEPLPDTGPDLGADAGCLGTLCSPAQVTVGQALEVVPSAGLPDDIVVQAANNNLDVVRHGGEVFLAFRTGPTHYASAEVQMHVVRSADLETWDFELTLDRDTDLREPRFLSIGDRLFLYFAVLGDDPRDFAPEGTMVVERLGPGQWSEPAPIFEPGFIPWRVHVYGGVPYLLGYVGGENIYDLGGDPVEVHWLTTEDGLAWEPVVPGQPVVLEGGSSETDFVFMDDGSVVAVSRNELGDELGFGTKICRAEAASLGRWECVGDPRKYDSPLLFRHGPEVFLIGRRNLNDTGHYDLGYSDMTREQQYVQYQLDYTNRPKRCSVWRVDPESLEVSFVVDLPSRGDTCFASILEAGADAYTVFNYTSPLDGPDVAWQRGQAGETVIYRSAVELSYEQ